MTAAHRQDSGTVTHIPIIFIIILIHSHNGGTYTRTGETDIPGVGEPKT